MQKQARRSALLHSGDHDVKWTHGKTAFVLCLPLYALENGYQHLLNRSDARGVDVGHLRRCLLYRDGLEET